MAHLALGLAIAFACFGMSVDARPSRQSESTSSRAQLSPRDETPAYSPIPPSALSDVEFRPSTSSPTVGDYVATGLGAEMDLVAQEYGLRDSESFYWGLDGVPLANLTAFAEGEEVKVLSVERFAGVLESAQCSNISIKLTFTQEADFQDVLSAWTWINDADENYVVLVTDTSQCNVADGDDTVRQPWHITHATFDDNANTVAMDAQPKTWNDAFGTWHLTVNTLGLAPGQQTRRRRGLDIRDPYTANQSFSLATDFSGASFPLPNDGSVACTNCSTYGDIDFIFNVDFTHHFLSFHPTATLNGSLTVVPESVGLSLDLNVDLRNGSITPSGFGVPHLLRLRTGPRIYIGDVVDIIPSLHFTIGSSLSVQDDVVISTGVTANIPSNSRAGLNFTTDGTDHFNATRAGWTPVFTAHDTRFSNNVEFDGTVGPQLNLELTVGLPVISDVTNFGAHLGLLLTAPELIVNATVFEQADAAQFACPTPAQNEGILFQLAVGVDFDAYEEVDALVADAAATQTIFYTTMPLTSTCIGSTTAIATQAPNVPSSPNGTYPLSGDNSTIIPGYAPYGSAPCITNGELICNGVDLFALCNWGTAIWQPVADGTACEDGSIVGTGIYANPPGYPSDSDSADCSVNGQLLCNGSDQFGLCNWGTVIWQPVAAGTQCQHGQIVKRAVYASPTPTPRAMFKVLK